MGYATAKPLDPDLIPVIDVTPLRDGSAPLSVAQKLHQASQQLGFIYITGHGIPDRLIDRLRTTAMDFFTADSAIKETVRVSDRHRGWISSGGAKMDDDAKPDRKESFLWGYQDAQGMTVEDHPLRGANQWPAFLPQLENYAMEWFQHSHRLAAELMAGFAIGLGLKDDFFLRATERPLSRCSLVYYPDQPPELGKDQFGVGPHTDFGMLTVLCQDNVGGLQVQDHNGDWIEAPPIEGSLIVNVGDLLHRWTEGAYKSTPHRVINSSGRERLSLVLAWDPEPETIIDARAVTGGEASEDPISCGDYLIWRFNRAFVYRQKKVD